MGQPLVHIDFSFKENEKKMMEDIRQTCGEMLSDAGFKDIDTFIYRKAGGLTVHEMGTARMGRDPQTSVLNAFNQVHTVKNVFVTDGSCMASSACQNPSLTYMALTARACAYAFDQLKKELFKPAKLFFHKGKHCFLYPCTYFFEYSPVTCYQLCAFKRGLVQVVEKVFLKQWLRLVILKDRFYI